MNRDDLDTITLSAAVRLAAQVAMAHSKKADEASNDLEVLAERAKAVGGWDVHAALLGLQRTGVGLNEKNEQMLKMERQLLTAPDALLDTHTGDDSRPRT